MQTFQELERKLLNQHYDSYSSFTKLLLSISVACITLLATSSVTGNLMYSASLICLFLSVLFGVIVQHRMMMNPIYHLKQAQKQIEEASKHQTDGEIELRRKPSKIEQYSYRAQAITFVTAFLFLSIYLIQKAI